MDTITQEERIYVELVKQTLKLAPFAIAATLLNAFILVLILWKVIPHPLLLIWFSATFFLALIRSIFLYKYPPASLRPDQAALVARRLVIGLGLSGIMWGCAGIFLFPVDSPAHQILIVFVLCGMVAGATGTFSSVIAAFMAFTIPALVPILIRFLIIGGDIYYGMSVMTLLYIVLTLFIARRVNIANRKLIEIKEDYVHMVEALKRSNIQLQGEIANRRRIEETLRNSEAQLRFLSSRLLSAQEEERKRIAHELHDSIGASLGTIRFSLENTLNRMMEGTATPESIQEIVSLVEHTVEDARQIYMNLRPSMLDLLGIMPTIDWFCRQFESAHTAIRIEKHIEVEEEKIPEAVKVVIFRTIQESFHNIAKYSRADRVRLSLTESNGSIELTVSDNGVGFDVSAAFTIRAEMGGLGLTSMRERVQLSGGTFAIESAIGEGTTVRASWD